jgi:hypothetical protein
MILENRSAEQGKIQKQNRRCISARIESTKRCGRIDRCSSSIDLTTHNEPDAKGLVEGTWGTRNEDLSDLSATLATFCGFPVHEMHVRLRMIPRRARDRIGATYCIDGKDESF